MKYYFSLYNQLLFLLDNADWIISGILHIFFNVNRINQWYLFNHEASCNPVCFKVVRSNIYFQICDLSTIENGFHAEAED